LGHGFQGRKGEWGKKGKELDLRKGPAKNAGEARGAPQTGETEGDTEKKRQNPGNARINTGLS